MSNDVKYTLAELAAAGGVTPRTVRFYISKGLLPPPRTRGRGAFYGVEHLQRLRQILQEKGEALTLDQIRQQVEQAEGTLPRCIPAPWLLVQAAPDAVVMTRADVPPWRRHLLDQAVQAFAVATAVVDDEEKNR